MTHKDLDLLSENELVALAQQGSADALEELCRRFMSQKKAWGSAGYFDEQDLLQEGMFGFLGAVHSFSEASGVPFGAYAAICVNNRINNARSKGGGSIPVAESADDGENAEAVSVQNPVELIESSENIQKIISMCERELSATERSALYCKISGLSYKEISEKLGISEKAADNALARARKKLRELIP